MNSMQAKGQRKTKDWDPDLKEAAGRAHCSKGHPIELRGKTYTRRIGNILFRPYTLEERRAESTRRSNVLQANGVTDDWSCGCCYCSTDGKSVRIDNGVWDAEAIDLITGRTWSVHFPELRGVRAKRPRITVR